MSENRPALKRDNLSLDLNFISYTNHDIALSGRSRLSAKGRVGGTLLKA